MHALYLSQTHIHTHTLSISPSAMAWLLAVTVIKALHYLFMADSKYELKLSRKGGNSWGISLKAAVSFKKSLKGRWQVLFRLEYKVPLCTLRLCKQVKGERSLSAQQVTWGKCATATGYQMFMYIYVQIAELLLLLGKTFCRVEIILPKSFIVLTVWWNI